MTGDLDLSNGLATGPASLGHFVHDFFKKNISHVKGCSIIISRIGGGWLSASFVMLRDGKQGRLVLLHERTERHGKKNHKNLLFVPDEFLMNPL